MSREIRWEWEERLNIRDQMRTADLMTGETCEEKVVDSLGASQLCGRPIVMLEKPAELLLAADFRSGASILSWRVGARQWAVPE